jgi:ATP-binding cassette, subfamily B (MDR/TAP), member 1
MSLLFGNLTQDFLNFTVAIQNIDPNDPQSSARVNDAAKKFRHVSAKDASYLTYIGASSSFHSRSIVF